MSLKRRRFLHEVSDESDLLDGAILEAIQGRRISAPPSVALSMLDIIACGLGGVALLAVLQMVIRVPLPPPLSESFIMAEITTTGCGQIAFSVQVQAPGTTRTFFVLPDDGNKHSAQIKEMIEGNPKYAASISYGQSFDEERKPCKGITHLYIDRPIPGEWSVRPIFYQFRKPDKHFRQSELTKIVCKYWTREQSGISYIDNENDSNRKCSIDGSGLNFPGTAALRQPPLIIKGP